jgi:hypothetical protein
MNSSVKVAGLVAILLIALGLLGMTIHKSLDNGETPNPNAGHPSKPHASAKGKAQVGNMTQEDFKANLKANRPDLDEAQLQKMTDEWWKVKSGQPTP